MQKTQLRSLGQEDTLKKGMATHSSILACGKRSLVGYSPWGHKESDMTERLMLFILSIRSSMHTERCGAGSQFAIEDGGPISNQNIPTQSLRLKTLINQEFSSLFLSLEMRYAVFEEI